MIESDVGAVEIGDRELPGGVINADNAVNVLDFQLCVDVVLGSPCVAFVRRSLFGR